MVVFLLTADISSIKTFSFKSIEALENDGTTPDDVLFDDREVAEYALNSEGKAAAKNPL